MEKKITFKRTSPTRVGVYIDGSASKWEIDKCYFWGEPYYSIRHNCVEVEFCEKLKEAKTKITEIIKENQQ